MIEKKGEVCSRLDWILFNRFRRAEMRISSSSFFFNTKGNETAAARVAISHPCLIGWRHVFFSFLFYLWEEDERRDTRYGGYVYNKSPCICITKQHQWHYSRIRVIWNCRCAARRRRRHRCVPLLSTLFCQRWPSNFFLTLMYCTAAAAISRGFFKEPPSFFFLLQKAYPFVKENWPTVFGGQKFFRRLRRRWVCDIYL